MGDAPAEIRAACPVHGPRTFTWREMARWWACEEYLRRPGMSRVVPPACCSVITEEQVYSHPDGDSLVQDARDVVPRRTTLVIRLDRMKTPDDG